MNAKRAPKSPAPPKLADHMSVEAQGRRIGQLRTALGWTNQEMAARTGIAEPMLSHFIHGNKKTIATDHIWRIAIACGVTTDFIIDGNRRHLPRNILKALPSEG